MVSSIYCKYPMWCIIALYLKALILSAKKSVSELAMLINKTFNINGDNS